MTELQQNRYDQLLRRVGDLKGPGSKVNDALTELFPTIDVENVPLELLFLSGTRIAQGFSNIGPTAAVLAASSLANPANSGQLVRLKRVAVFSDTAQLISAGPTTTLLAGNGVKRLTDTRSGIALSPTADIETETRATVVANFFHVRVDGINTVFWSPADGICVLAPATSYAFTANVVNTSLEVSYEWEERVAQPSELNL